MTSLLVILLTSLLGFAGTWFMTGGLTDDGGNLLAAVLVGFAVALAWNWGYINLERAYLAGRFDSVRRKLMIWSSSLGLEETSLLRLLMAVEGRQRAELELSMSAVSVLGSDVFAKAWVKGNQRKLADHHAQAVAAFTAGANATHGVDRAELFCEAGITLLQMKTLQRPDGRMDELSRAIEFSNEVDRLLRKGPDRPDGKRRFQYVQVLHRTLRALIYRTQGRDKEARRRLKEVQKRAKMYASLRARRLIIVARIEELATIYTLDGSDAFWSAFEGVRRLAVLPMLRQRLTELKRQVQALEYRSSGEEDHSSFEQESSVELLGKTPEAEYQTPKPAGQETAPPEDDDEPGFFAGRIVEGVSTEGLLPQEPDAVGDDDVIPTKDSQITLRFDDSPDS